MPSILTATVKHILWPCRSGTELTCVWQGHDEELLEWDARVQVWDERQVGSGQASQALHSRSCKLGTTVSEEVSVAVCVGFMEA